MYPIVLFAFAIFYALLRIYFSKEKLEAHQKLGIFLQMIIFFNVGIAGLLGFYAHAFMPTQTAAWIGWEPGSPFQSEIAAANLAFGVLGILSPWFRVSFWLATVINYAIFFLGAAVVHISELNKGNTAPYNSGVFLWVGDVFIPLFTLALMLYFYFKYYEKHKHS